MQTAMEIQQRIQHVKANEVVNTKKLESLQQERARLVLAVGDTKEIDAKIADCRRDVESAPIELGLLSEQLSEAQQREAQAERDTLLEQQNIVAENIEQLSEQFIEALEKANELNQQLHAALTAYITLKEKSGAEVLGEYCDGSQDSLRMLLETCQAQMEGRHTIAASGMVGSNVQIRL